MKHKLIQTQAIKEKCKDCIYDPKAGGTSLQQIEACTDTACPLHEYRPLTKATRDRLRDERIAAMTFEEHAAYRSRQEAAKERFAKYRR